MFLSHAKRVKTNKTYSRSKKVNEPDKELKLIDFIRSQNIVKTSAKENSEDRSELFYPGSDLPKPFGSMCSNMIRKKEIKQKKMEEKILLHNFFSF